MKPWLRNASVFVLVAAPWWLAQSQPRYSVVDIGTLGGTRTMALGVNNSGQIVGYSTTTNDAATNAFIYSHGVMANLGTLGGLRSEAYAINDFAQVVGWSWTTGGSGSPAHAFLYNYNTGALSDLGTLGGSYSLAYAINEYGQVAGESYNSNSLNRAFLWTAGNMAGLSTLGGNYSRALGINKLGHVVGTANDISSFWKAFLFVGGYMTNLGTLGGFNSTATCINSNGLVAGFSDTSDGYSVAFTSTGDGMASLGTLGGTSSYAWAINDRGQIVGESLAMLTNGNTVHHAFLYTSGTMYDLQILVFTNGTATVLDSARGINEAGQIIAQSGARAYLLTPLPAALGPPPPLIWGTISLPSIGKVLVLGWTNSAFSLQAASSATGVFTNIPGATSPYAVLANEPGKYFRLRGQ
jgi:probable HAF family extracellular repeat protein